MKLISFSRNGQDSWGAVEGDKVADLGHLAPDLKSGLTLDISAALAQAPRYTLDSLTFLPVIPNPGKIFCIGINYTTHIAETGRDFPTKPVIFMRVAESQQGHLQPLLRPKESEQFDFEGELAVIIGKPVRRVAPEDALDAVAGYSCYNDGSVRDWQRHSSQFAPGKNFFRTGGFGPWLVTADEVPDPSTLHLTTRLNGDVMQEASISDLVFGVRELISYCSTFTPLAPGDVIVTGTTGGVGAFRDPKVWMAPGDQVEVEISGIGTLVNFIADDDTRSAAP
jgi:2-keto-4-pentenoate hydratase/2-oxohepta-3-ene-1,7-dioic acid hydratase in catechol pathway